MTMSRVSWRTVVYFTIVAVRYRASLETRENIPETGRGKSTGHENNAGTYCSIGQVFHTTGRDLYKSVYLTNDIVSQPR